jgi:preprotein translocase SecE subunit
VATVDKSTDKSKKRVLRAPDTMRSQAVRTTEKQAADAAKLPNTFWGGFFFPFRMVGRGFIWVGHLLPFRILGRILLPSYFRNSFRELKLVTWPGRRESLRLTSAVLVFSVIFGGIVAIVDFGLDKLFKELILK